MNSPSSARSVAATAAALLVGFAAGARAASPRPASLTLQTPADVRPWSVYDASERHFINWITWRDSPDSCATFIHQPDTTGWLVNTPANQSSVPTSRGIYTGEIDRTVIFRAIVGGQVGQDSVVITFEIRREEYINGKLTLKPSYKPNTWFPLAFRNNRTLEPVDFGIQIRFGAGTIDAQGSFIIGLEDFEGFHIWRGIQSDGSDLAVVGEVSKEEAFKGRRVGGSFADSVYFYDVVPTLRQGQPWFSPFGNVDCLGTRLDLPLEDDQLFWFDCNAVNGFTYYYAVTTFDRGYTPSSSQQGLSKFDHCPVDEGVAWPCGNELVKLKMQSTPQNDLYNVYVVPNPFRSGTSRLTADNYHNYPDNFIRFVNVPADCTINVYTVSGDLVWWHTHQGGAGNVEWDTRNGYDEPVASGVYVYRLEAASGDSVYGRITIIR